MIFCACPAYRAEFPGCPTFAALLFLRLRWDPLLPAAHKDKD